MMPMIDVEYKGLKLFSLEAKRHKHIFLPTFVHSLVKNVSFALKTTASVNLLVVVLSDSCFNVVHS